MLDHIPAMVAYWDASERCRFANRAYRMWFGLTPESMLGKPMAEILGPALYAFDRPHVERALRGEAQEFERDIPDRNGAQPRHGLASYIPDIVDGEVRGFVVLVTDISAIKRAERALRESEERFRLTIDEAPIGMALVAPDGRFLRVNHVLCEIVGYDADELTGLTFQDITHPDDLDVDVELARRLARGEIPRYQLEKRYVRKDGSIVTIMLSGSVLRGANGEPLHFIAQIEDVTDRKRLEDEVRLAEARSSGILDISADAIVSIDEEQRITLFNEGAARTFGYSKEEALGASLDILIPERMRARHREHVERFARGNTPSRRIGERASAVVGLRKNGEEFEADAAISKLEVGGRPILTVALRDVSDQKRIEREQRFLAEAGAILARSLDYEETLTRIADLATREFADLCIVDVVEDDGSAKRVKVSARDPAKRALSDDFMRLPLDRSRPHLLSEVLETRRVVCIRRATDDQLARLAQSEEHLRALRAAEIHSMVAVPLLVHGKLVGAIALVSSSPSRSYGPLDVRLAEELARRAAVAIANARLYRAAQRATRLRDDVLGVVAHDLRNPLNAIMMQANMLRYDTADPARRSALVADGIERGVRRMNRLIQDLLDVARIEAGGLSVELAPTEVGSVIAESIIAQNESATAASIELRAEVDAGITTVRADRDRLLQIFENLLGNAIKFTKPGGRVVVGARPLDRDVLLWVSDTGVGVAASDLPRLFDRFWQAPYARRLGAGLGLPIVKGLVEAHGGRIWVDSEPGVGTTFRFTLPADGAEEFQARRERAPR